jgi:ABC-2 type transport system permease protein
MTSLSYAATDSATMLRRNLRHIARYPSMTGLLIAMPIVFLLIFVYVFGGTLGAGLGHLTGGRAAYLRYVTPGIIMLTVAATAQGTAISVAMDMTAGIIARFRTMAISRAAVLTGHVLSSMFQALLSVVVLVAVALAIGYRSPTGPLSWLAAAGVVTMAAFALTWLCVAMGMAARTVESASNTPMFLILLPFFGSGFVPTASMPTGLRWFAEYQPFTPLTQTLRGLLAGGPIGGNAIISVAWCAGVALLSYLWARKLFTRDPRPAATS